MKRIHKRREPFTRPVNAYCRNLLGGTTVLAAGRRASAMRSLDLVDPVVRLARRASPKISDKDLMGDGLVRVLRRVMREEGRDPVAIPPPAEPVRGNVKLLAGLLGLSALEKNLLTLLFAFSASRDLFDLVAGFCDLSAAGAAALLAAGLGVEAGAVQRAIHPKGRLVASGLLTIESCPADIIRKFPLKAGLLDLVSAPRLDRDRIFERFLPLAGRSKLGVKDVAHLKDPFAVAGALLAEALHTKAKGVNLLLHGPTGTGKTELARLLAKSVGVPLYVAGLADDRGDSCNATERLTSLKLGNQLIGSSPALLLFDEVEDLFRWEWRGFDGGRKSATAEMSKQWFNALLEGNPVPTIWITNQVEGIDPAFLRRFSYAVEMKAPTARVRARMLSRHLGRRTELAPSDVDAIAQRFTASPAQLGKAVAVARLVAKGGSPDREAIERVLAPIEKLIAGRDPAKVPLFDAARYRLDGLNAGENLERLAERMSAFRQTDRPGISLCLYGPPGTGKSEFARYLAWRMDRRVIYRRVSDIQSMWLGEAEKNIAAAFREAEEDDALLLFDEADSFLRERTLAVRSWEVSEVNEFLQQLESFRGVVACTTNLVRDLDQAALRRFVFKVEFGFLEGAQAWSIFQASFGASLVKASASEKESARMALARMRSLTPGDFAAVSRRLAVLGGNARPAEIVEGLKAECAVKKEAPGTAGF